MGLLPDAFDVLLSQLLSLFHLPRKIFFPLVQLLLLDGDDGLMPSILKSIESTIVSIYLMRDDAVYFGHLRADLLRLFVLIFLPPQPRLVLLLFVLSEIRVTRFCEQL